MPQKRFLSTALLSALISSCAAMADDENASPAGDAAQDVGHVADEDGSGNSAWRSQTRYTPIETLVSDNLQQLRTNAEVVFVGELTESALDNNRENSVPITRYDFAVESYLKGEGTDEGTISLRNIGGRDELSGETTSTHFSFDFTVGERYVVFLRPDFEKSTLPIIFALSVHEGGDVLANANGEQLMRLDDEGEMDFSTAASYSLLNYGVKSNDDKSVSRTTEMPAPKPGRGNVEIRPSEGLSSTANDLGNSLSEGVPLDSVVDQIFD